MMLFAAGDCRECGLRLIMLTDDGHLDTCTSTTSTV